MECHSIPGRLSETTACCSAAEDVLFAVVLTSPRHAQLDKDRTFGRPGQKPYTNCNEHSSGGSRNVT